MQLYYLGQQGFYLPGTGELPGHGAALPAGRDAQRSASGYYGD